MTDDAPDDTPHDTSFERIVETARVRQAAGKTLTPQAHGGALREPWTTNDNPRGSFRRAKKEALAVLAQFTPAAAGQLVLLAQSTDHRVSVIATGMIMDRVLGKVDQPIGDEETPGAGLAIDPKLLTPDERRAMSEHIAGLAELMALCRGRAAAAEDANA